MLVVYGGGDMAQWVRYLLHMLEDPSSDLHLSDASWALWSVSLIPAPRAWGQVDADSWLVGQSSQNGELQIQRDTLSQK